MRFIGLLALVTGLAWGQAPVIVDTDAGPDDLIALVWLLRQPGVKIEAVTVCNGLAHPEAGAGSVLRLLEARGLAGVPVYVGAGRPVQGTGAFPADWRRRADGLLRDELPEPRRRTEAKPAAAFLAERLMDERRPARLLALGPLTNLAAAMATEPRTGRGLEELVWMGGALDAAGNVPEAPAAEWNAWVDPEAAERVLAGAWRVRIVPLDATNRAPVGTADLQMFEDEAREWDSTVVLKILRGEAEEIRAGRYYGWDLLAAMSVAHPGMVKTRMAALAVRKRPGERGRLVRVEGARPNAFVGVGADTAMFRRELQKLVP